MRKDISDKDKKVLLQNIEVGSMVGDDKSKRIGKKLAERVYFTLWSVEPEQDVD